MAQLKSTSITGNLSVTGNEVADGNITASKFIKNSGVWGQFLQADGNVATFDPSINENSIKDKDPDSKNNYFYNKPILTGLELSGDGKIVAQRRDLKDLGINLVYDFKGVITWSSLMNIDSANAGDVYNISDTDGNGNSGADWVCITAFSLSQANMASEYHRFWSPLTSHINLSGYFPRSGGILSGGIEWAKQLEHSHIKFNSLMNATSFGSTISYHTAGTEGLLFATKILSTRFVFVNGYDVDAPSDTAFSSRYLVPPKPALTIQNNTIAICAQGIVDSNHLPADESTCLYVNGASNFNGSAAFNGNIDLYKDYNSKNPAISLNGAASSINIYNNGNSDEGPPTTTISLDGVDGKITTNSDIKTYGSFIGGDSLTLGQFNSDGVGTSNGDIRAAGSVTIDKSFIGPGQSGNLNKGRDVALLRQKLTNLNEYSPIFSIKTTNGSWDVGHHRTQDWHDILQFNYTADIIYDGTTDTTFHAVQFSPTGNLQLGGTDINIANKTIFRYNNTDKCIDVIFN